MSEGKGEETVRQAPNPYPEVLRPGTRRAIGYLETDGFQGMNALEIGPGGGGDIKHLLNLGFKVTAIDRDPKVIAALAEAYSDSGLNLSQAKVEEDLPEGWFDLVVAHNVFPFVNKEDMRRVIEGIISNMRPGAILCGNFFGLEDEWNKPSASGEIAFYSEEEILDMLNLLLILEFTPLKYKGPTMNGKRKSWHIYEIIAQKPLLTGFPL